MRFVSYGEVGLERAGILLGQATFDLEACMQRAGLAKPVSELREFLEQPDWRTALPALLSAARDSAASPLPHARIGAPIPRPGQVYLAGVNFRSHQKEVLDVVLPTRPVVLGKAAAAITGPYDEIVRPPEIAKLDYEAEVAVVIGKRARRVPKESVAEYIAGYTIMNDVSGRDLQLAEYETNAFFKVHFLGKSADSFAPTGPCLVTGDELNLDSPFHIRTWVNNELRQDGTTANLIFTIEELVAYISTFVTLHPGDIIATGTPGGVGHFMKPPTYLRQPDSVRITVEGIGTIENSVRDEPTSK